MSMNLWPFLIREFRVSSRRRDTFFGRTTSAGVVLLVVACVDLVWSYFGWDRHSVGGMARFTFQLFAAIIAMQALGALAAINPMVSPRIAGERERKTLDALLASRLSSAEIVLGTTAEGMLPYLSGLAVVFPMVLVMIPLGGVDPRLVVLALGGLLSTAFFMAALAAASSAGARDRRVAMCWTAFLSMVWFVPPILVVTILPRLWRSSPSWVAPLALLAVESNPIG